MKSLSFSKFMIAVTLLAFASMAFAASNVRKESIQIYGPTNVNGTVLPAGEYVAKWEGAGPSVQVSFVHEGKVVATVPAMVVESAEKAANTAAELHGDRELNILRFAGKKYSLSFNGTATQAAK